MTDEEYEEIKRRFFEDGIALSIDMKDKVERDYFKEAIKFRRDNREKFAAWYMHGQATWWEHVRKLVYMKYGVMNLKSMKPEWKEEANKLAIDIMKMVMKGE